jgi:hypothetical protein
LKIDIHLFFACPVARMVWKRAQLEQHFIDYPETWQLTQAT